MVKKHFTVQNLVLIALLIAIQVILSRFLSIPTPITKIGFSFIPIVVACKYLGVAEGVIVAFIGDLIGAILFPFGTFFIGYTITAVIRAFIIGMIACRKTTFLNVVLGVVISQVVCSLFLNTLWSAILYENAFIGVLITRIPQVLVMTIVEIIVIYPLCTKIYDKITPRLKYN